MRSRAAVLTASALAVLAVALAFGLTRAATRATPPTPVRRTVAPAPVPSATPAPPDLRQLRDVFRFADQGSRQRGGEGAPALQPAPAALAPVAVATPPPGPRLVGLLRRPGGLVAVLSLDGAVELASAGQTVADLTVLSVGEDGVRVRRVDGTEETLTLPD